MNRRLYRSRKNRMVAGVCGGVADYFGIDPTLVRLLYLFIPGFNLMFYIIAAIIIPDEPYDDWD